MENRLLKGVKIKIRAHHPHVYKIMLKNNKNSL